jgi:serine/threonine protein kinase/predicted GTPase
MDENAHFWTIIGVEETRIPELKRLENLFNELPQEPFNEDKLLNNADALIRILETLCKNSYPLLKTIDIEKRQKLIQCIVNKWKHLRQVLKQNLPRQTWITLYGHAQAFTNLCSLNFNNKPLMFAKQVSEYQDMPKKLESELINLIDGMREKYPNLLNDILDEEYKEIKKHYREKIVITVLGSTKASKSSLINFLLENHICPTGNRAATARLTKITYGEQIRLILISSSGNKPEIYLFDNQEELLNKASELIILKNEDRKSQLCQDEILIELPIDELKGVELWDVPGFDENPVINNRINEILKDTDLILAVLPQQESLRQTAIDFIKPCLKQNETTNNNNKPVTKICFIISQIDKFKPDEQSKDSKEKFLQHIYDKICEELPTNFQRIDYRLSNQFIPMCSSPVHSINDYLECRQQFIEKSCQWFSLALHGLTRHRTNVLLKSVKEFSTYENIFRRKMRYEYIKQIFNKRFLLFRDELTENVNQKLHDIHGIMKRSIGEIAFKCRDLFYNDESLESIEEYIRKQVIKTFQENLRNKSSEIIRMVSLMSINFSNAIELKPAEIQVLKQVLDDTLTKDYYSNIIEQYQDTSPYHLSAYLTRICHALSETIKATINIPFGDFDKIKKASEKFIGREKYVEERTMDSITNLVNEVLDIISDKLQSKTERALKDILDNQLSRVHKQIDKEAQKYMHSSIADTKIDCLRQFSTQNSMKIKRMHLDILDIQFNLDYLSIYEINHNERLDQNGHFPIFTGTLTKDKTPIAAKLIPLKYFQLQQVVYIRELKHKNVIKYYGVKKANDDQYYILMARLDCNLRKYLKDYSKTFNSTIIDDMIIQIIKGLDYIHTQLELIHRDIKLETILVNKDKKRFLIGDLGDIHREPITCIYKEGYLPPELFSIDNPAMITEKCDIYSLGIVIREIIRLADLVQPNDGLIISWLKLANKCCSEEPLARPTCKNLLEKRFHRVHTGNELQSNSKFLYNTYE